MGIWRVEGGKEKMREEEEKGLLRLEKRGGGEEGEWGAKVEDL